MTVLGLKMNMTSDRDSESASHCQKIPSCIVSASFGVLVRLRGETVQIDAGLKIIYCVHSTGQGRVLIQASRRALFLNEIVPGRRATLLFSFLFSSFKRPARFGPLWNANKV